MYIYLWPNFCLVSRGRSGAICRLQLFIFSSSFTCGLAGALASNPVDVVRTRMMNQRAIVGHVDLYKGTLDGILKVCTLWAWVAFLVFFDASDLLSVLVLSCYIIILKIEELLCIFLVAFESHSQVDKLSPW